MIVQNKFENSPKSSFTENWTIDEYDDDYSQDGPYEELYEKQAQLENVLKSIKFIISLPLEDRANLARLPLKTFNSLKGLIYALTLRAFAKVPMIERQSVLNCIIPFQIRLVDQNNDGDFWDSNVIEILSAIPMVERENVMRMIEPFLFDSFRDKNHFHNPFKNMVFWGNLIKALSKNDSSDRVGITSSDIF